MLAKDTLYKCSECEKKARHTFYGKHYCREHYILEMFDCTNVHNYLDRNKIPHLHSAIDKHIILGMRNKDVIEICGLLDVEFWFGKGTVGNTNMSDYMHIDVG